jgi:hypothetical protein
MTRFFRIPLYFLIASLTSSLVSCGGDVVGPTKKPKVLDREFTATTPANHYFVSDRDCQSTTNSIKLDTAETFTLTGDPSPAETTHTLTGTRSELSLRSRSVNETTYGRVYSRTCDGRTSEGSSCMNEKGERVGYTTSSFDLCVGTCKYLRVCDSKQRFNRESYESIALTSIAFIDQAQKFAFDSLSLDLTVSLELMPTYLSRYEKVPDENEKTKFKNVTFYETNNLYYAAGKISVLAESEADGQSLLKGEARAHLWESPFVLAHEFGHHVHASLELSNDAAPKSNIFTILPSSSEPHTHTDELTLAGTESQLVGLIWSGVSEGFADLFGFYAVGYDSSSLGSIAQLVRERDPLSSTYYDESTSKVFDEAFIGIYKQTSSASARFVPGGHKIGAAFAHSINFVLDALHPMTDVHSPEAKAAILKLRSKAAARWVTSTTESALAELKRQQKKIEWQNVTMTLTLAAVSKGVSDSIQLAIDLSKPTDDALKLGCARVAAQFSGFEPVPAIQTCAVHGL